MATLGMDFIIVCETNIAQGYRENEFVVIETLWQMLFVRAYFHTFQRQGHQRMRLGRWSMDPEQLAETGQSAVGDSKGSSTVMRTSSDQSWRPEQVPSIEHASQQFTKLFTTGYTGNVEVADASSGGVQS